MHKAERLFQLVTLLRGRRLAITAKQLADILEVSERTIYRDIQALMVSGVPIEGEAGIGYLLPNHFELPPLMFSVDELMALMLGSKMVKAWSDKTLAKSATSAIEKIEAIIPEHLQQTNTLPFLVPDFHINQNHSHLSAIVREAVQNHLVLNIHYIDAKNDESQREIEPLGLVYWGGKWTVIAFCLLRQGYREFRIDRITNIESTSIHFEINDNKNIDHYIALVSNP
ncbi:helix-turn-helix transcriptional regulator [Pseudoalteromonas denitrificans]|uniref:HTH domain-containing protein n=1 Tax=Pseudoalteromonas denitrificans DSM 6059 TaxID=1123010 RepID=A0A1I1UCL3_9GAMM|nr:YafY family protein [Pseudoalteromonas denitrificans]SFD67338.1 HTH domain-containing protein [Pseudoalteromonas denitrificans DSM 6059]